MTTLWVETWLDRLTNRWWFYVVLIIIYFLPAYTTLPFNPAETPQLVIEVLSHAMAYSFPVVFPLFKLLPLMLIAGLWLWGGKRWTKAFNLYAALTLLLIAVFQNAAQTPGYGFSVLVGNLVVCGLAAGLWLWEAVKVRADLSLCGMPKGRWWIIPPALLAFWFPVNTALATPGPDFSLVKLAANEAGLTFCMMMPVYLAVQLLAYPKVNPVVFRVSAFIGLVTGLLNVVEFFAHAPYGWWLGVVHLPLLILSVYAVWTGRKRLP